MSSMSVNRSITSTLNQVFSNGHKGKCAIIEHNTCDSPMTNIKEIPAFHETIAATVDLGLPLKDVTNSLQRISKNVQQKFLSSERGKEILAQADSYDIPYDVASIDWFDLTDKIYEFEDLIKEAKEYRIDWENHGYDPVALRQEIDQEESNDYADIYELRGGYYNYVTLGV